MKWSRSVGRMALMTALIGVLLSNRSSAIFLRQQIEAVPVDRVVRNLEEVAKKEPQNAQVRVNLARAHAMAYAIGGDTLRMVAPEGRVLEDDPYGPWVSFANKKAPSAPITEKAAQAHLRAAIQAYEDALRLDPRDVVARLGYGWCLQQARNLPAAIGAYRTVVNEARTLEKTKGFSMFRPPVAAEASEYLIPLLDPQNDKEEIGRLRDYIAEAQRQPRAITPVVVPLGERNGTDGLVDHHARIRFDADGSGLDREWTWISKDVGWLVYDHQGRGEITSALQLFGNVTFWMFWSNGYEAMRALDDNQDGSLAGDELKGLGIWRDANGDGVSDRDEVKPLADWGIVALSTRYRAEDESDIFIAESRAGVTFRDGTTRPTYDVWLHQQGGAAGSSAAAPLRHDDEAQLGLRLIAARACKPAFNDLHASSLQSLHRRASRHPSRRHRRRLLDTRSLRRADWSIRLTTRGHMYMRWRIPGEPLGWRRDPS